MADYSHTISRLIASCIDISLLNMKYLAIHKAQMHAACVCTGDTCADPEGGTGGLDPPEKSQKYRVF